MERDPIGDGAVGYETVWIFQGEKARFASGVFHNEGDAREWITRHQLSGVLTEYPVGNGCYDIAIEQNHFSPSRPHHGSPDHVAGFSPGWTKHFHFQNDD